MKKRLMTLAWQVLGFTLVVAVIMPAHADVPQQCIQNKNRFKACPHQLYRADTLPSQNELQLLCICVTDFLPLLQQPGSEQQRIEQNMTRRQYQAQYKEDLPVILAILKRQR
ncbi:MAG: hypothetical protein CML20_18845 [Rheinheimera sp.]|uniref:hypothetical protein n=1 Tax=Arsukibacterium sp. UBA3155 TaxID=1946058 RepID=UPI000C98FAF8|nr:hypothetical protein [Arsukibacterium sp. UBA3155]MAD76812.1 hypothetical protein [Rheinheimera sp.]